MTDHAGPPPSGCRWRLSAFWAAGTVTASVLSVGLLALWGADLHGVGSSTGAWTTAYVQRVLQVGDFAAVANISQNYSTTTNPLYPLLVAGCCSVGGMAPALAGHLIAAGSLGLVGVLLVALWSRGRGLSSGVLGAGALCWPPLVAAAVWIRPDTLAIALCLACILLAVDLSRGRGLARWVAAGILLGLTHLAREYMLAPAGGALAIGWCLDLARRPPGSRLVPAVLRGLALLVGLSACAVVPLALGFWPWNGLASLWSYGNTDHPSRFGPAQLHYLPTMAPAWLIGAGGLVVAMWRGRGPARATAMVTLGALSTFVAFMASHQQSPQYYITAHVLLLACCAGWLDLVPWRWARRGLVVATLVLAAAWSMPRVSALVHGGSDELRPRLHSEAWPAPALEIATVVDWSMTWAWASPLVLVSPHVENLDALFTVRHDRPVAVLYNHDWERELPDLVRYHRGEDVWVVTVSSAWEDPLQAPGVESLGELRTGSLVAAMYRYDGDRPPPRTRRRDYPCIDWRGTCQQRDWLTGGVEQLGRRAFAPGPEFAGGTAPGIMPFGGD